MACADCGCLVDRGTRVELCGDRDCCCRDLPVHGDEAAPPDGGGTTRSALAHLVPPDRAHPGAAPTWSSPREAVRVVVHRRHLRATTRIAAVVGTVLFAINQLDVVVTGRATAATWIKAAVTYLVPFTVSNLGILTATHRTAAGPDAL
jgi:hypothetical protein